jgi:UDP-glucose 4-epimerase
MSVLVTGGAGYIGSHMVLELLEAGEEVVVLDNLSTGFRWAVPKAVPLFVGDCGDFQLVATILRDHKVDAIIHFAAFSVVAESVAQPLRYFHNNCDKSRALIEAAVAGGIKSFIFSSTASVYGNPHTNPIDEEAPLAPMSPYGTSKLITEMMLADVARVHDFRYVTLRYFNVAGADPKGRSGETTYPATHLVKIASQTAAGKRDHIEIYGTDYATPDGTAIRDYIHVRDVARAHSSALAHLRAGGASGVFNCGYSRGYSVREIIEVAQRVAGRILDVRPAPRRPGDPAVLVAETSKIRAALGWVPEHDNLDEIVHHAVRWEERLSAMQASCAA